MNADLVDAIDALLPQTQCKRCGYPDCHRYAVAIANRKAAINQCPPGGQVGITRLAELLKTDALPLNPQFGVEGPRTAALIDEKRCIGCALCIQACPVDAIVGSAKRMHTVLTEACSGCDLCVPPCPVDCIDMVKLETLATRGHAQARRALDVSLDAMAPVLRRRYQEHQRRAIRQQQERERRLEHKAGGQTDRTVQKSKSAMDRKAATIAAALERARKRRGADA